MVVFMPPNARRQPRGDRAGCRPLLTAAHPRSKLVILPMGPDPEPQDVLALTDADCPVPQADAHREDGTPWMNLFELKARMRAIDPKGAVGSSGPALDMRWEARNASQKRSFA